MKKTLGLLIVLSLLSACKAHMIETRGASPQLTLKGLVNPPKGGAVRYLKNGLASMRNARRADAEKQMRAYCGGDYTISDEGPRSKLGAKAPIPKGGLEMDEYWYILFDCPPSAAVKR